MRRLWLLLFIVIVVGIGTRWIFLKQHPLPTPRAKGLEPRGVYHVHTTRSDGREDPDDIAAAAAADGLDFVVVTDHNIPPLPAEHRHGVLVLYGEEESTPAGHRVMLPVGTIFWAHPLNRRVPWTDWDARSDGMEILSADDMWRDALQPPWGHLLLALIDFEADPLEATYQLYRRPGATLTRYDQMVGGRLSQGMPFSALCSVDAHGLPPYATAFAALQLHLPGLKFSGEAAHDALAVTAALAGGRFYCGLDGIADASGLRLNRLGATVRVAWQGEPPLAETYLFCPGQTPRNLALPASVPTAKGCRLEVRRRDVAARFPASEGSWIYTGAL